MWYASAEQAANLMWDEDTGSIWFPNATLSDDVWAIGCLVYAMSTGKDAFPADSFYDLKRRHASHLGIDRYRMQCDTPKDAPAAGKGCDLVLPRFTANPCWIDCQKDIRPLVDVCLQPCATRPIDARAVREHLRSFHAEVKPAHAVPGDD